MPTRCSGSGLPAPANLRFCAATVTEPTTRLQEEITVHTEAAQAAEAYLNELTVCLRVDRRVAELAWQVREAAGERIPLVNALIAATARAANAILVHRDPHPARIPRQVVKLLLLPSEKAAPQQGR